MNRSILAYVWMGVVCVTCADTIQAAPKLEIQGIVAKPSQSGGYGFSDFAKSKIGSETFRQKLVLNPGNDLVTNVAIKARVEEKVATIEYKYTVLLGALAHAADTAKGRIKQFVGLPYPGAPVFELVAGWAFLWSNPSKAVAETSWIVGATDGTTMVLEIAEDNAKQRVYMLEGRRVTVTCKSNSNYEELNIPGEYVVVTNDGGVCEIGQPKAIVGARKAFIDELKKIATAADWP